MVPDSSAASPLTPEVPARSEESDGASPAEPNDGDPYNDPNLRWRCKEQRCGAAFLTREQLRTHVKMGQHGDSAPPVEEIEAATKQRLSRVPPRSGGYTLRGAGGEEEEEEEGYGRGERGSPLRREREGPPARTATPEDVNMLSGAHLPPFIPKEENLVSPNAEEARLRELERQKVASYPVQTLPYSMPPRCRVTLTVPPRRTAQSPHTHPAL